MSGKIDEKEVDSISLKLDTSWTDIFWKNKSSKDEIDEIYFAFLNRWFFNEWIVNGSVVSDDIDKAKKTQSELYGKNKKNTEINDAKISYKKFDLYKGILDLNPDLILKLEKTLDNFSEFLKTKNMNLPELQKIFFPLWDEKSKFRFIPEYKKDDNGNESEIEDFGKKKIREVMQIDQMERPVFFAICKYFEQGKYEKKSFRRWLRFAWNLTSDARLRDTNAMIQVVKKIDEFTNKKDYSHNIYDALSKQDLSKIRDTAIGLQFKEECIKAKQIVSDSEFESKIEEAEKTAFFAGQIRFLYQDEKGDSEWSNFDKKLKNAKLYFDKNGIKKAEYIAVFVSSLTKWNSLVNGLAISRRADCWKNILLNQNYQEPINSFLEKFSSFNPNFQSKIDDAPDGWREFSFEFQHELCDKNLLEYICSDECQIDKERKHPSTHFGGKKEIKFYQPYFRSGIMLGTKRNAMLSDLYCGNKEEECKKGKIISNQKIKNANYFLGWDIEFYYLSKSGNGNWFLWTQDRKIGRRNKKKSNCEEYKSIAEINSVKDLEDLLEKISK